MGYAPKSEPTNTGPRARYIMKAADAHQKGRSGRWQGRYCDCPFLIVEGRGVLVPRSMALPELAMLSRLAQVVRRLDSMPLRLP
jgi:hypothetical protein